MLKNYTSSVSAAKSIAFIESKLAQNGAMQILKEYDKNQRVIGICFNIPVNGKDMFFKLPAKVAQCEKVLKGNLSSRARPKTYEKITEQAERTAWKILSDWTEVQMSMVELTQVEIMEIFLPYVYNSVTKQTYFEQLKTGSYKALLT